MSAPTATEIRDFINGYGIDKTNLSDEWIENRRDGFVIPYIERITRQKFSGVQQAVEYYSGNDADVLYLNRRPVVALIKLELLSFQYLTVDLGVTSIYVVQNEGVLKSMGVFENYPYISMFPKGNKNIRVTYSYGYADYPADVKEAVIYLCCEQALGFIGSRTGGGNVSGQAYNRQFGERGKYTEMRSDLNRQAMAILKQYSTSVVGS